jgi:hypothetical protein
VLQKLRGSGDLKHLIPWYGVEYKTNDKTTEDESRWTFEGLIRFDAKTRKIHITEIPIGISIDDYNTKVLQPMIDRGVIRKVDIMHMNDDPHFVIHGYGGATDALVDVFSLRCTMTKTCMNLLDKRGIIRTFGSPADILDYWYEQRRECVDDHHKEGIRVFNHQIDDLLTKYKFVKVIVDDKVRVKNRKAVDVVDDMVSAGVSVNKEHLKKLLNTLSLSSLTVERYEEIKKQYDDKKSELVKYKKITVDDFINGDMSGFAPSAKRGNTGDDIHSSSSSKKPKIVDLS